MALGRTARHYKKNPKSRAKKAAYDKEYNKKPSAVKKRVEANRARRKAKSAGKKIKGLDYDHATGRFVKPSVNRGRAEKSRLVGSKRRKRK